MSDNIDSIIWGSSNGKDGAILWRKKDGNTTLLPLDPNNPVIPDGYTTQPPTIYPYDQPYRDVWNESENTWVKTYDYGRVQIFVKATGQPARAPAIGDPLPEEDTAVIPPPVPSGYTLQWDEASQTWDVVAPSSAAAGDGDEDAMESGSTS